MKLHQILLIPVWHPTEINYLIRCYNKGECDLAAMFYYVKKHNVTEKGQKYFYARLSRILNS